MADPIEEGNEAFEERTNERPSTAESPRESRPIGPGTRLVSRFVIASKLGEGGMGQVFRAFDEVRQTDVALKIIGDLGPRSIGEIKREFRAASELVHPNLVRLHELFCDGPEWFFTMDLVEGVTVQTFLQSLEHDRHERVRSVFRQLALGLRELHGAGTLHGDLKPSNFLITNADQRVVLLDFGLSRPLGHVPPNGFEGTPAYTAPEQALGEALTEAADWYAFGVVLYEALTGVLPRRSSFAGRLEGVPDDLRSLCSELLSLSPDARPTGGSVARRFGLEPSSERISAPVPSRFTLVNRSAELVALESGLSLARSGTPSIVLLHGPSGIGKTSLVRRFVEKAQGAGAIVLTSRCRERESMRHKALDGLIDDLVVFLEGLSPGEAKLLLPEHVAELTILFPAMRAARALASVPVKAFQNVDQGAVRQRAIGAFRDLLCNVAQLGVLVVWIDDLQWSDEESALLLERALTGPEPVPFLFVGSYRSDPGVRGALLDALFAGPGPLPAVTELALGPLHAADSQQLALQILARSDASGVAIARSIGEEAAGHPLFVAELAYAEAANDITAPRGTATLTDLVSRRVSQLTPVARTLLECASVAGAPRPRSLLQRAYPLSRADLEDAVDLLRAHRLVRSTGLRDEDTLDVHHDRIRDIVLSGIPEDRQRQWHLSLARALEEEPGSKPEFLAAHWEAGGEPNRAARYWFTGADEAFQALAFAHAADLYARGMRLAQVDEATRREYELRRAEALVFAGKGELAAAAYLDLSERSAPSEVLELRRRAAEQLLLSGHVERGFAVLEYVLKELRMPMPRNGRRALLAIAGGRLLIRVVGLRSRSRRRAPATREELARVDASWTAACALSVIDFLRGADSQNRHLLLALRAGEPRRLLRALTLEISFAATPGTGSERRAARLLSVARELAEGHADPAARGLLFLARGIASYLQGHNDAALSHCEDALGVLTAECSGTVWEIVTAQRFAIAALFFLGRLRRLSEFVPPLLVEAEGTGNRYAVMCFRSGYSIAAWLARDRVSEAARQLDLVRGEWTMSGFQLSRYNLLIGETFLDFYTGDIERAHARIVDLWARIEEAQLLRIAVLRVQLNHLRAASAAGAAERLRTRGEHARAARLQAEAHRFAKRLEREATRRARPLGALVHAALEHAEGKSERARQHLERAAVSFEEQGMKLFGAAARHLLGKRANDAAALDRARKARADFESEGVVDVDRMTRLFAPGFDEPLNEP